MTPLNIERMPKGFKRYFISFIEMNSGYAYVASLNIRPETQSFINRFLKQMTQNFARPRWIVSDKAEEYVSNEVISLLGNMDI